MSELIIITLLALAIILAIWGIATVVLSRYDRRQDRKDLRENRQEHAVQRVFMSRRKDDD